MTSQHAALYPGTFDPITHGHFDIMHRASRLFDKTFMAVSDSSGKDTLFDLEERVGFAETVLKGLDNIEVIAFDSLVTDHAREVDANVIIRGLRAVSDYEYEIQMAGMNRKLFPELETVYLTPAENLTSISSSLVREIASYQGDIRSFVHESVADALEQKFN